MKIEIGCFGLPHKSGGYFFSIVNSETFCSFANVNANTIDELYELAKTLNLKNIENIDLDRIRRRNNEK